MQTERKSSPAGKTKDVWDDVDESFFKVRGTGRVQKEGSWSLSRSANDAVLLTQHFIQPVQDRAASGTCPCS